MRRLFGTDRISGIVNKNLTNDMAYKIGLATAKFLNANHFQNTVTTPFSDKKPTVLVGTDTRPSKGLIFSGLTHGLRAGGINVISVGIIPTAAIAYLTQTYDFVSAGIMITASHDSKEYNGINIIGPDGYKLHNRLEQQIESFVYTISEKTISSFVVESPGKISYDFIQIANNGYMNHLSTLFSFNADYKLKIAVDCSNGAASSCKSIFENYNIEADIYNTDLSGEHVNEKCGLMNIEFIQSVVKNGVYDCGLAFDSDASRCLLVDKDGEIIDGDYILAIIGKYLKSNGKLKNDIIVGTMMSNIGLAKFCESNDIKFIPSNVSNKYIIEEIIANQSSLGGDQSGHIVIKDLATTSDGILTALFVLHIISSTYTPLHKLRCQISKYPQVSDQIAANSSKKNAFVTNTLLQQKIRCLIQIHLGDEGRAVIFPFETENYIRIVVEGKDEQLITAILKKIKELIRLNLN